MPVAEAAAAALALTAQDYPGVAEPRPFAVATAGDVRRLPNLSKRDARYTADTSASPPTANPVVAATATTPAAAGTDDAKMRGAGSADATADADERKVGSEVNERVYARRRGATVPM